MPDPLIWIAIGVAAPAFLAVGLLPRRGIPPLPNLPELPKEATLRGHEPCADYRIETVCFELVVLRDLDMGNVSVTNDAAAVVRAVAKEYPDRRIFYYDSSGDFAEMLHDDGAFTGFAPA